MIVNISGDISLMDANDAVSYVQDLAGDSVNIIFGAKYDDSMVDEATITVIGHGTGVRGCSGTGAARCGQSAGQYEVPPQEPAQVR